MFEEYARRSFRVQAVRLTNENIEEVAKRIGSTVKDRNFQTGNKKFLTIIEDSDGNTSIVLVGDWLTWVGGKYKRYTHKTFKHSFKKIANKEFQMEVEHQTDPEIHARNENVRQLVIKAMQEAGPEGWWEPKTADNIAHQIIKLFY